MATQLQIWTSITAALLLLGNGCGQLIIDIERKPAHGDSLAHSRCAITERPHENGNAIEAFPVNFYYKVESVTESTDFLPELEAAIFSSISNIVFLCYGNSLGVSGAQYTFPHSDDLVMDEDGDGRKLRTEEARRLGLISISSEPDDELATNGKY
jgi:hypothetical protein